jgi:hypothetical protein
MSQIIIDADPPYLIFMESQGTGEKIGVGAFAMTDGRVKFVIYREHHVERYFLASPDAQRLAHHLYHTAAVAERASRGEAT